MPTYLSVSFQYSKEKITGQTVRHFCDALLRSGLSFAGGYWESEGASYDEIVCWNQRKLEQNFELGDAEHYSHDYKQMLFNYMDFSEVRLFIMNERESPYFSFELIIPEKEFFIPTPHTEALRLDRLELVENLAVQLWACETMDCIQAGWELADEAVSYADIAAGKPPRMCPFCIIPQSILREEWQVEYRRVGRDGICIRDVQGFQEMK